MKQRIIKENTILLIPTCLLNNNLLKNSKTKLCLTDPHSIFGFILQFKNYFDIYFLLIGMRMMIKFRVIKLNYKLIFAFLISILLFISICIYYNVKANNEPSIKIPIIMYHSILKSKSGDYIIHPDVLEKDLIYIKENGYEAITMADLIDYVYENKPLPNKSIIITFDDGHYNNLTYVVPLLEKYNMKAVISIVGKYTDTYSESDETNPNYSYLRWKDINELINSGIIEFQNHTYDLHTLASRKGSMKKYCETKEHYSNVLSNDILKLQDAFKSNTNYVPNTFTYPFGAISKDSFGIIKDLGFKASLSCEKGVNYITKDTECLYLLKRNNRPSNISTEQFFKELLK